MNMSRNAFWGISIGWCLGLVCIGVLVMPPQSRFETALPLPRVAENTPPLFAQGHPDISCWPSLETSAVVTQEPSVATVTSALRGSIMSGGRTFAIHQDAAGHLYRQPQPITQEAHHNDKQARAEESRGRTVHDTGKQHDPTHACGVVKHLDDIQRCDGHNLPRDGAADGNCAGLSSPTY